MVDVIGRGPQLPTLVGRSVDAFAETAGVPPLQRRIGRDRGQQAAPTGLMQKQSRSTRLCGFDKTYLETPRSLTNHYQRSFEQDETSRAQKI